MLYSKYYQTLSKEVLLNIINAAQDYPLDMEIPKRYEPYALHLVPEWDMEDNEFLIGNLLFIDHLMPIQIRYTYFLSCKFYVNNPRPHNELDGAVADRNIEFENIDGDSVKCAYTKESVEIVRRWVDIDSSDWDTMVIAEKPLPRYKYNRSIWDVEYTKQ